MNELDTAINETCVGPSDPMAGKASSCQGCPNQDTCSSDSRKVKINEDLNLIQDRMALVKNKILILSGKGGVGKSTFSAQLSFILASRGFQVGLLDIDICGPSIPRMLGLVNQEVHQSSSGWSPVYVDDNLAVMSIGFMLPNKDDAIIWRGPKKTGLIKQFLSDVDWGTLDYLIFDTPPGTSDEHISIVQYLKQFSITGAVVITTPQEVSMADVRKEINFCKKTGINVLGLVENMSTISLNMSDILDPLSGVTLTNKEGNCVDDILIQRIKSDFPEFFDLSIKSTLFSTNDPSCQLSNPFNMANTFQVPYLGCLPMDPNMTLACEKGISFFENFPKSLALKPLCTIVDKIVDYCEKK